ncbi:MAG TPA: hypothetical protein VNQ52_04010 [Microbacteriaceae bacterium]|nr:hypothetical protein [Microbacteriaceae bacterium]
MLLLVASAGLGFAITVRAFGRPTWSWALALTALASAIVSAWLAFTALIHLS